MTAGTGRTDRGPCRRSHEQVLMGDANGFWATRGSGLRLTANGERQTARGTHRLRVTFVTAVAALDRREATPSGRATGDSRSWSERENRSHRKTHEFGSPPRLAGNAESRSAHGRNSRRLQNNAPGLARPVIDAEPENQPATTPTSTTACGVYPHERPHIAFGGRPGGPTLPPANLAGNALSESRWYKPEYKSDMGNLVTH